MDKLKRQERYIVVKLTDLADCSGDICPSNGMSEAEIALRNHLASWHVPTRHCVVVERDWPEYESVWRMIEDRVYRAALSPTEQPGQVWIPVSERLPEPDQVVALMNDHVWMNTGSDGFDCNWYGAGYLVASSPRPYWTVFGETRAQCLDAATHWAPLPDAPLASAQPQGGEA